MLSQDEKRLLAAANNADLHEAIFDANAIPYRRTDEALVCEDHPPPYFANIVTNRPGHAPGIAGLVANLQAAAQNDGQAGLFVKDSFAELDPVKLAMDTLLEASWLWREPQGGAADQAPSGWRRIGIESELAAWHEAWRAGGSPTSATVFLPNCLQDERLTFMGRFSGTGCEAGCLLNQSGPVVGLSNLFALRHEPSFFEEIVEVAGSEFPGLTIVGYEQPTRAVAAPAAGFEEVGKLRVLMSAPVDAPDKRDASDVD
ncbi:MAG: hypothetical protein AAF737_05860 [Pseudomonadota bacterium]